MDFVRVLMRYFSYAYHGVLALFLLGISLVALSNSSSSLRLEMLPWKGATLVWWVFGGALVGLVSLLLALKGTARVLFLVWSAVVFVFLVKGYILSPYYFERGEVSTAVALIVGALVALAGAWFQFRAEPSMKKKLY